MSVLAIYDIKTAKPIEVVRGTEVVASRLADIGVTFERWRASAPLTPEASQDEVLAAYREDVDRLVRNYGFRSVDVVSLRPDSPNKDAMRQKFLNEHIHSDFEVRFFVEGRGLFYLHADQYVYLVLCGQGDLISVPANTPHWFDMGTNPDFKCIRLFTIPDGWVAEFTGDPMAHRFPDFDTFVAERG